MPKPKNQISKPNLLGLKAYVITSYSQFGFFSYLLAYSCSYLISLLELFGNIVA